MIRLVGPNVHDARRPRKRVAALTGRPDEAQIAALPKAHIAGWQKGAGASGGVPGPGAQ